MRIRVDGADAQAARAGHHLRLAEGRAQNEAVRLDQRQRELAGKTTVLGDGHGYEPAGPDPIAAKDVMMDARALLAPLRERERVAVLLRGMGCSYEEAAQRLGVTQRRLNQLLARAGARIREQEHQHMINDAQTPARVKLLDELRRDPPPFLRAAIGRSALADPHLGGYERRLEWSRLSLAIVDHRVKHGISDPAHALGSPRFTSHHEDRVLLEVRIARYNDGRTHARDRGRGVER